MKTRTKQFWTPDANSDVTSQEKRTPQPVESLTLDSFRLMLWNAEALEDYDMVMLLIKKYKDSALL